MNNNLFFKGVSLRAGLSAATPLLLQRSIGVFAAIPNAIGLLSLLLFPFSQIHAQKKGTPSTAPKVVATDFKAAANLSDSALLDIVQKQTVAYFWDFTHPVSGLARERSNVAYDYG
ncbi:MAG: hypothetical protein ACOVQE_10565, partial [Chitinophagaceae bacterium]